MNIFYFTKLWPRRGRNATFQKNISLIETLINQQFKMFVCSADPNIRNKYELQQFPLTLVDVNEKKILNSLIGAKKKPDIAIFDSPETETLYSAYIYNKWNKCPRILQFNKLKRLENWRKQNYKTLLEKTILPYNSPMISDSIDDIISPEQKRSIFRSDYILAGNQFHYYLLKKLLKIKHISRTPMGFPVEDFQKEVKNLQYRPFRNRQNFIFFSDLSKKSNQQSLQYLIHQIWPGIQAQLPQAELHIYGEGKYENIEKTKAHLKNNKILYQGNMEDVTDLSKYKALLYPCQYSSNLRLKVLQSWFCHLPVVTTPIGAEGTFFEMTDPFMKEPKKGSPFLGERILSQEQQKQAKQLTSYYNNNIFTKKMMNFTFGGSYNNFTVKQFVNSAVKIYNDEQYWNKCLDNCHQIIKKSQNQELLARILKQAIAKSELASYEGRSRQQYVDEWTRYSRSKQFHAKMKG